MDSWYRDDADEIRIGDRQMRVRRRRRGGFSAVKMAFVLLIVAALAAGGYYYWSHRPTGLEGLPNPAVVAPGGFRASIGPNLTITVGLEVRNTADAPVTLVSARVVAPEGLQVMAVTMAVPGEDNSGFALEGDLPAIQPIVLGTDGTDRNAIVAARLRVDCERVVNETASDEQIFVTVRAGDQQREEELTPPVLGDQLWLIATAQRACLDPVPTTSAEPPLPPLPDATTTPPVG